MGYGPALLLMGGSERRLWVEFEPHNRCAAPLPVGPSRLITGRVTMRTKNMRDDAFRHHGIAAGRLDLAERSIWQLWVVEKGLDPTERLNTAFKFGKIGSEPESECIKARRWESWRTKPRPHRRRPVPVAGMGPGLRRERRRERLAESSE